MDFALIVANGVLFRPTLPHSPIPAGIRLAHALESHYKLSFALPSYSTEGSQQLVQDRITEESLFASYVFWGIDFDKHIFLLQPNVVSLFVSASPIECAEMMHKGFTSLLFAHPSYMRPEFRPDHKAEPRPWDAIEQESRAQALLRAQEERDESMEFINALEDLGGDTFDEQ